MTSHRTFVLSVALAAAGSSASAQSAGSPAPAPAQPAPTVKKPCALAESRQFDFWIGDWDVIGAAGKQAGTNLIRPILGGCVLQESWKGAGNNIGESFNIYDATRKVWHQSWVDNGGNLLQMDGKFENGSMMMSDRNLPGKTEPNLINEVIWTPNSDGSVRQHWRMSKDGGKTWQTVFDGKYVRSSRPQPK